MSVTIFHNPKCSKSRQTLDLLREKGIEPNVIHYLETPPSVDELRQILDMLNMKPRDILRKKEAKECGLDDPGLTDEQILEGLVANPRTIERPIVIRHTHAVLGRPPEKVLEILD